VKLHITANATVEGIPDEELEEIRRDITEDVEDCLRFTGHGKSVFVEVTITRAHDE
jgi:hypothetical protein